MTRKLAFIVIFLLFYQLAWAQGMATIQGRVFNESGEVLSFANVALEGTRYGSYTNEEGVFIINNIPSGNYILRVSQVGYQAILKKVFLAENEVQNLSFTMIPKVNELAQVEVFGEKNKQPEKLETITRLPLAPSEQIQSISVISDRLIREQGALTISEATRNVPGVYTFATYGNKRESMSSRGFRGIPVLKNGVRINSDFRGIGVLTDMIGVETIQVLKGANAITQGLAGDIGSPGGIINIVTKTPRFTPGGFVSMRAGSFNQFRPSFDIYGPLNEKQTVAYRINGAYEHADSYRDGISLEKFYVNPSFKWRPDNRTTITLEMDYLDDSRTPDLGTINLATNDINAIYDLPYKVFLGFESDRTTTRNITYAARFNRELNENLSIRAAFYRSELDISDVGASLNAGGGRSRLPELEKVSERYRSLGGSTRLDNNSVLQLDLIGAAVETGMLKHTFQVGVDYRTVFLETANASLAELEYVDIIDIFEPLSNQLPAEIGSLVPGAAVASSSTSFGVMAQDVMTITDWAKTFFGVRYSSIQSSGSATTGVTLSNAWNPLVGLMVSPLKNMNVFASYTSSTNPRSASRLDVNGEPLGNERIDQLEAGIKSDWIKNRLRFNLTLFKINNTNMNMPVYDENWNETGYYTKGGNDERKGLEVELTGRILKNLELIAGYAYIDAKYKEHASYYYNSAPLNTPKHTANFWANYRFDNGLLKGLSLGAGVFYIGERPNNDWARTYTHEGIVPGQRPFEMEAYANVNLQASYLFTENLGLRLLVNNVFDEIGYNAYRTSYINQTAPRNFAGIVTYKF